MELTGAVAVDGVLAKHVELSVFGDDAAAAVVAGRVHRRLALQLDHLLRLVGLWLSAALGWTHTHTHTQSHTHTHRQCGIQRGREGGTHTHTHTRYVCDHKHSCDFYVNKICFLIKKGHSTDFHID